MMKLGIYKACEYVLQCLIGLTLIVSIFSPNVKKGVCLLVFVTLDLFLIRSRNTYTKNIGNDLSMLDDKSDE